MAEPGALDMYPRERRKPADAAKSPARFERNAWRICPANRTLPSYHQRKSRSRNGAAAEDEVILVKDDCLARGD